MIWNPWKEIKRLREIMDRNNAMACDDYYTIADLRAALGEIVAEEKETSNATVKRMARIARGALGEWLGE